MDDVDKELEDIEVAALLDTVYKRYGYDFRQYNNESLKRRIHTLLEKNDLQTISELQNNVLHDPEWLDKFLLAISVSVTAMFRDPTFYAALRSSVVPFLRTYPTIKIWVAGCSTGEEAYSLAILLHEEGLYDRCSVYATDMNQAVLKVARDGIFPIARMKEYTDNYLKAGGSEEFSTYYTAAFENIIFNQTLKKNLIFAQHNLATDQSFNEFNLIICRNVMIYFNESLQRRVFTLLHESLAVLGILALGNRESVKHDPHSIYYEDIDEKERIYKRIS
jgi:chemotaxis protein methyltransferase CheR